MAFDFQNGGDDKGHHHKQIHDAQHKLHDEVHNIFSKINHGLKIAKPHMDHALHGVHKEVKSFGRSAERELHGTATPADKHKLETVGKVAATVFLPHLVIGSAVVKTGIDLIQKSNHKSNVHHVQNSEHYTTVNHGDSKQ